MLRIVPPEQIFCDKIFAQITLGIKIIQRFISEGVNG